MAKEPRFVTTAVKLTKPLADMISTVIEGGIILAKTLRDPAGLGRQLMMQRSYIKLLFAHPV